MIQKCRLTLVALLVSVSFILSSSIPVSQSSVPVKTVETPGTTATTAPAPAPTVKADKKVTLSYQQLVAIATQLKGSKLTFKEKLGLKLFGKRIINKGLSQKSFNLNAGGKSQIVALILCACLGDLGIHRFYLGYT